MAKFFITTAIDYANGAPHLGHAFEKIGADVIARYRRLCGDEVLFLTGTDEHGQKVAQTAAERGVSPQQFVDEITAAFLAMWKTLSISNDQFIRTTDPAHKAGVRALIERIRERNPDDFYEHSYEGWYCVGCELFKKDTEIVDQKCALHPTRELSWTVERNWFFRLSRHAEFLRDRITSNEQFLRPDSRCNEMLAFLDQGLEDISVTRSRLSWAIPFPFANSDGEVQGTWVWFDALPNYLTATGFPAAGYEAKWPAQLHVVGKDINKLHSLIWPAMLRSAELPLPEQVWVHGFVNLGGERFSKSAGVRLELSEAIERFGVDAFRYFLMREVPFHSDGNFSWERFEERYNADLANAWGNLASRTIAMIEKYRDGVVPNGGDAPTPLDVSDAQDMDEYHAAMNGTKGYMLHDGLRAAWQSIARGNEFVDRVAPWKLAKEPALSGQLDAALGALCRHLARHCVMLFPFMPNKSAELWAALGAPGALSDQRFADMPTLDVSGWRVSKGPPMFPKETPSPSRD